jgi:hypothetical protein
MATRPDKLVFEALPAACGILPITPRAQLAETELSCFVAALRDGLNELHRCYDELLADLTRSIGQAFGIDGTRNQVRLRLAARAEAVKEWVADPALKSFVFRVADRGLDDLLWLESVVALLTQKPPSGWRDDDRAKFEVALVNMARLFSHVERLAFDPRRNAVQQRMKSAKRAAIAEILQDAAHVHWHSLHGPDDVENGIALCKLIREHGGRPTRSGSKPEQPFYHLRTSPFWTVKTRSPPTPRRWKR